MDKTQHLNLSSRLYFVINNNHFIMPLPPWAPQIITPQKKSTSNLVAKEMEVKPNVLAVEVSNHRNGMK